MTSPFHIPAPRLFAFAGSGTDPTRLSVDRKNVLVVVNGPHMHRHLDELVEKTIRLDPATRKHHFDSSDSGDEAYVLRRLALAGYTAYFMPIKTYIAP